MVNEARFRPAISANAYVDVPNRALLIGSYSQDNLPRRRRRGAVRGALSCGCAASVPSNLPNGIRASVCSCLQPSVSFARQRTSAAASAGYRGEKVYWSAQRPPKEVAALTSTPDTPQLGIEEARLRARQRWRIRYDGRLRVRVDLPQDALEPLGASRLGEVGSPSIAARTRRTI